MGTLTAQTNFTILDSQSYSEEAPLILLPENDGINALRELHYPNDILPKITYESNPDKYDNFDTSPLTARPILQSDQTIGGNVRARWPGYIGDLPIVERWIGSEQQSHMFLYFLRRLWEYYSNPPAAGYITWWPKDRTIVGYNIEIESLTVGGAAMSLDYLATRGNLVLGEIVLTFRIVSEV